MPEDSALGAAIKLTTSMEAAAALAAHIRVRAEGVSVDPAVAALLDDIAAELYHDAPNAGPAGPSIVGMVNALLRQSAELIANPGRMGEWDQLDEAVLQGYGRMSMALAEAFRGASESLDGLADRLATPGSRFLDVGTGVGWLAIATARTFPRTHVTGIDIFEPALDLARRNVAQEDMAARVDVRLQDATQLDEFDAYDAIWLPLPFMPKAIVTSAVAAARKALRVGGWLLPGAFAAGNDRLAGLLVDLRTIRSGGHPWDSDELLGILAAAGLTNAHEVPRTGSTPVRLFAAQRSV